MVSYSPIPAPCPMASLANPSEQQAGHCLKLLSDWKMLIQQPGITSNFSCSSVHHTPKILFLSFPKSSAHLKKTPKLSEYKEAKIASPALSVYQGFPG